MSNLGRKYLEYKMKIDQVQMTQKESLQSQKKHAEDYMSIPNSFE